MSDEKKVEVPEVPPKKKPVPPKKDETVASKDGANTTHTRENF